VTLAVILERLLRSRLYRSPVTITTDDGRREHVLVRELSHGRLRSHVRATAVTAGTGVAAGTAEVSIPLDRIVGG